MQEQLEKSQAQYKACHYKHRVDHQFQVGDQVWLHISKERMKGEGKKLKPIIWSLHHLGEDWDECFSLRATAIHADLLSGECGELETL